MTVQEFEQRLLAGEPAPELPPLLAALGWARKGNWMRAHEIAQAEEGPESAWVHAYLHRSEGDEANARYWYRQARRAPSQLPPEQEWREIATVLLTGA